MSWALLSLFALQGLTVRTTTPRALCPTVPAVEQALSERLGVIETGGAKWELELENGHRVEPKPADLLQIRLRDESGQVRFEQRLDVSGAACDVRAESVAIIVAEYFETARVRPESKPEPAAAPVQAPPKADFDESPEIVADEPSGAPDAADGERSHALLSAGLGFSAADWLSPGLNVRVALSPSASLELAALVVAPAKKSEALPRGGSAEVWALPVRVSAAWKGPAEGLAWWLGPEALLSYEQAESSGIAASRSNRRMVLGVGAQAGARLPASESWAVYLVGALDYVLPLAGSRFEIDGETVLQAGPVRWAAALGVEKDLF